MKPEPQEEKASVSPAENAPAEAPESASSQPSGPSHASASGSVRPSSHPQRPQQAQRSGGGRPAERQDASRHSQQKQPEPGKEAENGSRSNGEAPSTQDQSTGYFQPQVQKSQRLAVLVDVQNLFYSAKHQYQSKVDFGKLLHKIARGRKLTRAICYIVETPDIDQSSFINVLRSIGYEVKSKELRLRPDGSAKGDWDMGIAIDAIGMGPRVDCIALVSGDGDFVDLLNMLNVQGCITEVFSFPSNTAEDLKRVAVEYTPLDSSILIPASRGKHG